MPLVGPQPLFEKFDGRDEIVSQRDQQVDDGVRRLPDS